MKAAVELKTEELVEAISGLRSLLEGKAGVAFRGLLSEQIENRTSDLILSPMESLHDLPKAEYQKGEIAGLKLALALPEILLKEYTEEYQHRSSSDESLDA